MVEIARIPDRAYDLDSIGGKSVDHVAWYDVDRGPVHTKDVMDVVTDDGSVYRWTRFNESEKWTFEVRVRPDGTRDDTRRVLPSKVDELVDRTGTVLYK